MTGWQADATRGREVGPLELFFDLVFVFAVSQLSAHLLEQLSWRGAGEMLVLLVGVFGVWAYSSFQATIRDVAMPSTQLTLLAVMFLGLFMNAGIRLAFADDPWLFVVPLLLSQIGTAAITSLAVRAPQLRRHFRRTLVWFAASTPLWIVGGLLGRCPGWAGGPQPRSLR